MLIIISMKNIYKVSLISWALVATGITFASYSWNLTILPQSFNSNPQTAIEQKDTDKETNDDVNGIKDTQKDTDTIVDPGEKNSVDTPDTPKIADKETNDDLVSSTEVKDNTVNDEFAKETKDDNIILPAKAITEESAKKIVLSAYPKGTIVGVETENENNVIVYNVSLNDGTDVKVDVQKWTIVKTDKRGSEKDSENTNKDKSADKETNDD